MASEGKEIVDDEVVNFFLNLPNPEQACVLEKCLVQDEPVIFYPWLQPLDLNKRVGYGITLLQRLSSCQNESTIDLLGHAREIFYSQNKFLIWWHGIEAFLNGASAGVVDKCAVDFIVRNVTVRYNMREEKKYGKDLVTELERLFCLNSAECRLTLEIIGGGTAEGSDPKTLKLLGDVCSIVERLIAHFGTHFNIQKGLGELDLLPSPQAEDLTSYWDKPNQSTRENVYRSEATFKDFMQVQVESWLGRTSLDESSNESNDWSMVGPWELQDASISALFGHTAGWLECLSEEGTLAQECFLQQEPFAWEALL
ncbi:hypothetical protein GGI35DRAFT_490867 [Trichoderma velutinum]